MSSSYYSTFACFILHLSLVSNSQAQEPQECPLENCAVTFNGCSTCKCTSDGSVSCSSSSCRKEQDSDLTCLKCDSNLIWTCSSPCWSQQDCMHQDGVICEQGSEKCVEQCACPPELPIYDSKQHKCIHPSDCPNSPPCDSNFVWNDCGTPCWTERTCENPKRLCKSPCVPQCECPDDLPLYHPDRKCIALDACESWADTTEDSQGYFEPQEENLEVIEGKECPEHCEGLYVYDCVTCFCDGTTASGVECEYISNCTNGEIIGTENGDNLVIGMDDSVCLDCKEGLEWKECGSPCWKSFTCKNPMGTFCLTVCERGCQCPSSRPLWDEETHSCVSLDSCSDSSEEGITVNTRNRRYRRDFFGDDASEEIEQDGDR